MTLPVFSPPQAPSANMVDKPELNILRADFGDGYSQAAPRGLNHIRRTLSLRFDLLERAEKDAIVDFLTAQAGTKAFLYTLPGEASPTRYTCEDWEVTSLGASLFNVAAKFRQDFSHHGSAA